MSDAGEGRRVSALRGRKGRSRRNVVLAPSWRTKCYPKPDFFNIINFWEIVGLFFRIGDDRLIPLSIWVIARKISHD